MKKWLLAAVATMALPVCMATSALAATVYYNGALTTSSPTFDAPSGSSTGTAVQYYSVQPFTVDTSGAYSFESSSINTAGATNPSNALDTLLELYSGTFNPATPNTQIASQDDYTGVLSVLPGPYTANGLTAAGTGSGGLQPSSRLGGTATSTVALTAGTQYYLVTTSFRSTDFTTTSLTLGHQTGPFFNGISGPGNISVPEPTSLAFIGLGALSLIRRRR